MKKRQKKGSREARGTPHGLRLLRRPSGARSVVRGRTEEAVEYGCKTKLPGRNEARNFGAVVLGCIMYLKYDKSEPSAAADLLEFLG